MKSRAQLKGHPIHPILVAFPIAFFTGTFLFDLLGFLNSKEAFIVTAMYLEAAGVIGALAAAIPGLIDYVRTVPPESSAKKRATQHALVNTGMLLIFAGTWFYRRSASPSIYIILFLELAGVALLAVAGWLGGTLVYRNQIGVDPRYAQAGKWKEKYFRESNDPIEIGLSSELKPNQMQLLHVGNKRIALACTENGYFAFEDKCSHKGGSLAGGSLICGTVQCPWHGSQFDVKTGSVKAGPAKENILTFGVTENNGKLYLKV